jgi:hypothetical protein
MESIRKDDEDEKLGFIESTIIKTSQYIDLTIKNMIG